MKMWLAIENESEFGLNNLPFGIFSSGDRDKRVGVALGQYIIDVSALLDMDLLVGASAYDGLRESLLSPSLNKLMGLGNACRKWLRAGLQDIFGSELSAEKQQLIINKVLVKGDTATLYMPIACGDYTDFYSSRQHAFNVGTMFRGPENALMPNWLHLPVGYHGRSSSIVVSGTPIRRPWGQIKPADSEKPIFSASKQMDFELEMAYVIGTGNELGTPIKVADAMNHVWGYMLFNDWSARDIQSWEYVPLGPFLGKNFGSTISAWVVTPEALEPFRIEGDKQDLEVLPYLNRPEKSHLDIHLEVIIKTKDGVENLICKSNTKNLYWSVAQQIAHHTVNGCNLQTGDISASGTISGSEPDSYGSMLELSWRGTKPLMMKDGTERKFLNDGDTVIMRAYAENESGRIGFGEVVSELLPALDY